MGNCIPSHQIVQGSDDECDKKTDDTLIVSSSNNGTTHSPAAALEQCPTKPKKRKGMEGLLDCGFEYRFLKCPRHANDDDHFLPISCSSTMIVCLQCSTRLFHVDSGTMITANNRKDYIADGAQFDEVANLCQEITQERLQQCFHLKFVTVNNGDITNNNNNKENEGIIINNNNNQQEQPQPIKIQALVDQDYYHHDDAEKKAETSKNQDDDLHHHHQQQQHQHDNNDNVNTDATNSVTNSKSEKQQNNNNKMKKTRPILVIIAGKGKSRAGILSVKHLLISGMEQGSAICHLVEAKRRGYGVMLLDPNTPDANNGMEVIEQSFQFFFGNNNNTTANNAKTLPPPPQLYILAHSASGGFVARLLFEERQRRNGRSNWLEYIQSLVFTDSTHNIQWYLRDDPTLCDFLQSPKCLYIRNTSEHPSDTFANHKHKQAGELMSSLEQTIWWRRRFGTIRTVWAGTSDHSLMCWVAREVIWIFFDACSR